MKLQLATTTTLASCRRLRRIGDFHKWEPKHLFLDFHVTLLLHLTLSDSLSLHCGGVDAGCPNKPNDSKIKGETWPPFCFWAEGVACNIYI